MRAGLSVLGSVLVALVMAVPCRAQVELKHAPRYQPGQKSRSQLTVKTKQTLTISGMPIETESDSFFILKENVETAGPAGQATVRGAFEVMQLNLKLPGGISYQFDSGNPGATQSAVPQLDEVTKMLTVLAKVERKSTIAADGRIEKVEYVGDDPLADIPETFRSDASPEKMKREANQDIDRLPMGPVNVGDAWERDEVASLGSGQTFQIKKKYTYLGTEEHGGKPQHKIGVQALSIAYEVDAAIGPLEVKESKMEVKSSEGTLWYDADERRVVESSETGTIVGELTFKVGDQELPATLELTITTASKIE